MQGMMIRLKKSFAIWAVLFFGILFISLYLMLENISQNSGRNSVLDESVIDAIEHKIQRIEMDMENNRKTIQAIKASIREMLEQNDTKLSRLSNAIDSMIDLRTNPENVPGQVVKLSSPMCYLPNKPLAKSDINVLDLYRDLSFDNTNGGVWKQGYPLTYTMDRWSQKKLRVFVVPHTHNDPGWIKTFDRYFTDDVQSILDNMVEKLNADKRMRFMYAEMSFFSRWWKLTSEHNRNSVKKFIKSGQFELVTGGWVMNDEAVSHYSAIVDQLLEGHLWINSTLGFKPKSHWTIDPFGYSSTNPYLIKQTGITSMLIQRVHYIIKKNLSKKQSLEFMWRQQWDAPGSADIFTHMMPFYSYDIPHTCGPNPKICCQFDFIRSRATKLRCPWKIDPIPIDSSNVEERAHTLLDQYRKKSTLYRSNVVLIPLGDDFRYKTAKEWDAQFHNYQALFDYMNSKPDWRVEAKFGTLTDYFDAFNEEIKTSPSRVPTLTGDFFSYSDRDDHYWTGFFTSRPFYKRICRELEHHIRAAEIALSLSVASANQNTATGLDTKSLVSKMTVAREQLSIYQHHDGITGTAADFVVVDYGNRLLRALKNMKEVLMECLHFLMLVSKSDYKKSKTYFLNCDEDRKVHDSLPEPTVITVQDKPSLVFIYNSLAQERIGLVTVHVTSAFVVVRDSAGHLVKSQVQPVWDKMKISSKVFKLSLIMKMPALGITYFTVSKDSPTSKEKSELSFVELRSKFQQLQSDHFKIYEQSPSVFSLRNSVIELQFNKDALLQSVAQLNEYGRRVHLTTTNINFMSYGVKTQKERSGAYLFLPDGPATPIPMGDKSVWVIRGPILSEVHVRSENIHHVVRLVNTPGITSSAVDIMNWVDIRSTRNFEFVMRLDTDIDNVDRVFYTDQNGFQMQKRKTFDKLPLQGNFYPMATNVVIEDQQRRLSIISGQSCGVSNLVKGRLELMLDRRLMQDDNRGLGQPVVDNKLTPNLFRLLVEYKDQILPKQNDILYPTLTSHWMVRDLIHPLFVFPQNPEAQSFEIAQKFNPLTESLPCQLHLLKLRYLQNEDFVLMLHNMGFDCSSQLTGLDCKVTDNEINLKSRFNKLKVSNVKETSLTLLHDFAMNPTGIVSVPPMEIKTFQLRLS